MENTSVFQKIVLGIFLFLILVGVVLFAMRQSGQSQQNETVTLWGTLSEAQMDSFTSILSSYGEDLDVIYVEIPEDQFVTRVTEALATGAGPDLVLFPSEHLVRLSNKLMHIPFDSYPERSFKDDFIEQGEMFFFDDGIVAIPFMVDPLVMYWNRSILSDAGFSKPPAFWSELPNFVDRVVKTDGTRTIYQSAVALGEYRNVTHAKEILQAMLIQANNPVVDLYTTYEGTQVYVPVIEDADLGAVSVLDFFVQFADPSSSMYSWNRSLKNSTDAFVAGELALYFGYASEFHTLRSKNPNLNYDVAQIPQGDTSQGKKTFGRMYALGISNATPYVESAFNTILKLTSEDSLKELESVTGLPPVRRSLVANFPTNSYGPVFYSSALASRGVADLNPDVTNGIFQEMIESVLSGRSRSAGAIGGAQNRLEVLADSNF